MMRGVVLAQLYELNRRMLESSLSMQLNYPAERNLPGGCTSIGDLPLAALALKDIPYRVIYGELAQNNAFHIKLPDGGLLLFQFRFSATGDIENHRMAFFPSPELPTIEEAPYLYEQDELFADIMVERLVRFPVRFDFDPTAHVDVLHPRSHLTLGQFENCRIPVQTPLLPNMFLLFILRNFYFRSYLRNKNIFDKKMKSTAVEECITVNERRVPYFVIS